MDVAIPNKTSTKESGLQHLSGLTTEQVASLQLKFGKNKITTSRYTRILRFVKDTVLEPMFVLLLLSSITYFVLGSSTEGGMMIVALLIVSAISFFQEIRSSNAIAALNELSEPMIPTLRNGRIELVPGTELVPGDLIILEEGMKVPADARVLEANDLTANESVITGESFPVEKSAEDDHDQLFQGTSINSGKCNASVTATGINTVLGKIGQALQTVESSKSHLQIQINKFIKRLAFFGFGGLVTIFIVNLLSTHDLAHSILLALTIALSAIPEEIPVAFSSFMALGALKLSRLGIIARQPQTVENLGRVDVICLDKTGTITQNKMSLSKIETFDFRHEVGLPPIPVQGNHRLYFYATLASERDPFDEMEKAIWEKFREMEGGKELREFTLVHEYSLAGRPPMMSHVYSNIDQFLVAGKGAVERIVDVCKLDQQEKDIVLKKNLEYSAKGFRILGVCSAYILNRKIAETQDQYDWHFEGLLIFHDPLKANIPKVFKELTNAGIEIKIITGDYPVTASHIAKEAGVANADVCLTGEEIFNMNTSSLAEQVATVHVFARVFPDAKLKIVQALKENKKIVAMTGDGVNDAPALKGADVGIAMGQRGTGIARQAADLILTDDNLEQLVTSVREGRKIFSNFKKAIRYIISIHIPIILTASLPMLLGWKYSNIFSPIHVIFLELIMGPTCSIFYEREPAEEAIMKRPPVGLRDQLFEKGELAISIVQGLFITAGLLFLYYHFMNKGLSIDQIRNVVFTSLICSNLILTFANRSFSYTIFETLRYRNGLEPFVLISTVLLLSVIHFVPFVTGIFQVAAVQLSDIALAIAVSVLTVAWIDLYKIFKIKSPVNK